MLFRNFNNAEIMEMLSKLGYDEALNSTKSRVFMVSFLSSEGLVVTINDAVGTHFYHSAWENLLKLKYETENATETLEESDGYVLFSYPLPDSNLSIFGFTNNSESDLTAQGDLRGSLNCMLMPSGGICSREVAPGSTCFLGAAIMQPGSTEYLATCSIYNEDNQENDQEKDQDHE